MSKPHVDGWVRDEALEHFLRSQGVDFTTAVIDLDSIDKKSSLQQSGRIDRLNDELVEQYAEAMERGAAFPALLCAQNGNDKRDCLSGNHRVHAAEKARRRQALAYLLTTKDKAVWDELARILNCANGAPSSMQERLLNAKHLVETYGYTVADAATKCGLKASRLHAFLRSEEVRKKIGKAFAPTRLTDNHMQAVAPLIKANQLVGVEVSRAANTHRWTAQELADVVKDVRKCESEADMLATMNKRVAELRKPVSSPLRRTPIKTELLRVLAQMRRLLADAESLDNLQVTDPQDIGNVKQQFAWVAKRMREISRG